MSAGTGNDADTPIDAELIAWADIIFVMEKSHRNKVLKKFRAQIGNRRIVCLDIPDDYEFMDPSLIRLLESRVGRYLV